MRFVSDIRIALADWLARNLVWLAVCAIVGVACLVTGLLVHAKLSAPRTETNIGSRWSALS